MKFSVMTSDNWGDAYMGAENFDQHKEPVVAEVWVDDEPATVIADKMGVFIHVLPIEEGQNERQWLLEWPLAGRWLALMGEQERFDVENDILTHGFMED